MIKRLRVPECTPQAQVSILNPMEWQGRTDDDGLSPFTLELAGCRDRSANVQAQETEMPDLKRWLPWAFKST